MRRTLTLIVVLALTLGACSRGGGGKDKAASSSTTRRQTTTTLPPKVAAPLTGELVEREIAERPAVSIKVNNNREGGPQAGLDSADVVFEERVEGGFTRFVAVFQSKDTDLVGPIRSIRPTDPSLVWPFGGVFTFSDGVPQVVSLLKGVPVHAVYERQGGAPFTYPSGRHRPYKTFAATARLRQEGVGSLPPQPFANFLSAGQTPAPGDGPAASATVTFGPRSGSTVQWDAASGRWLKTTAAGVQVSFTTVIIQLVTYSPAGYRDVTGSPVDKADLVGSGSAFLLVNGQKKAIHWSKPSAGAMTAYTDVAGKPVVLPVGPILVMLPAVGSAVTIV